MRGGKFLRAPSVQGGTRTVGMVLPFHRWRDFHLKLAASKSFPVSPTREEAVSDSPGPGHFFHSRDVSISLRSRFLSQTVISQLLPCSRQRRHQARDATCRPRWAPSTRPPGRPAPFLPSGSHSACSSARRASSGAYPRAGGLACQGGGPAARAGRPRAAKPLGARTFGRPAPT